MWQTAVQIPAISFSMTSTHFSLLNAIPSSTTHLHAGQWWSFFSDRWAFYNICFMENALTFSKAAVTSWSGSCNFRLSAFSSCVMSTRKARSVSQLGSPSSGRSILPCSLKVFTSLLSSINLFRTFPQLSQRTSVKYRTSSSGASISSKKARNCTARL